MRKQFGCSAAYGKHSFGSEELKDLVQGLCLDRQHDIQTLRKLFFSSEILFKRGDGFLGCVAGTWNVREEF